MRILVTGAGGLIGGYLSRAFDSEGHQVVATYRNSEPDQFDPSSKSKLVMLDVADGLEHIEPVDVVIHAAAHTHLIPDSTAADYVRSNVIGTLNVAKYAQAVQAKLVVYLSTLSVYGVVEASELYEDSPLNKPELYGLTKYLGEMILKEHASHFPVVCIRLPGVVGKGYFVPWLGTVLSSATKNEVITVYNPDSMFNNIVDLMELHAFISRVMEVENTGFNVVNLAGDEPISVREVVQMIVSMTNSRSKILEQRTDRQSFSINTKKITTDFDFQPAATRSIVERYVNSNKGTVAMGAKGKGGE